ncbi:MAG: hypothetical protein ABSA16_12285 [Thermoguttaceae bacterium]|jgi:hypothetical protein
MGRRAWHERTAVYIVRVDVGFIPSSNCQWPENFTEGRIHAKNLTLDDARAVVRVYNTEAQQKRDSNTEAWDRLWAICACCVRSKGWDRYSRRSIKYFAQEGGAV